MRGGKREGAGRKKGSRNKRTAEMQARIRASGMDPLTFMISVMRNINAPLELRFEAAKQAAPFVHPKLSAIEHSGPDSGPVEVKHYTDIEAVRIIGRLLTKVDKQTSHNVNSRT